MRWTTRQLYLLAIIQARHFSLLGHIAWMPDEREANKILTASPLENWRRPPGCPCTTSMKTIQQDLKSSNLSLNEAVDVAENCPLWRLMSMFDATHSWKCMSEMKKKITWLSRSSFDNNSKVVKQSLYGTPHDILEAGVWWQTTEALVNTPP